MAINKTLDKSYCHQELINPDTVILIYNLKNDGCKSSLDESIYTKLKAISLNNNNVFEFIYNDNIINWSEI